MRTTINNHEVWTVCPKCGRDYDARKGGCPECANKRKAQPTLFDTGIVCAHCGKDPLLSSKNAAIWPGFMDADTQQYVCWSCKKPHYDIKLKTKYAHMYSELPVVIPTTVLNQKVELKGITNF